MIRLRPALWPTLISLPILVLSLGLGLWQMERREWKGDILDRITTNQAAPPMTLEQLLSGNPLRHEYGRVKLAGTFQHDHEFFLAARSLKNKSRAVRPRLGTGERSGRSRRGPADGPGRSDRPRAPLPDQGALRTRERA